MRKELQYWSKNNQGIYFIKKPFRFTEATAASRGNDTGVNDLVGKQIELRDALYGKGLNKVRPTEMLTSVLDQLGKIMREDPDFKKLPSDHQKILIKGAINELSEVLGIETPLVILSLISAIGSHKTQKDTAKKPSYDTATKGNKGRFLAAHHNLPAIAKQPEPVQKEQFSPPPREFTLRGNTRDLPNLQIFFAGNEIDLSHDPDQQKMLATILVKAATDTKSEISKIALFNSAGGASRAAPLFLQMKKEMDRQANGSAATLKPNREGNRYRVNVPIKAESNTPNLKAANDDESTPPPIGSFNGFD